MKRCQLVDWARRRRLRGGLKTALTALAQRADTRTFAYTTTVAVLAEDTGTVDSTMRAHLNRLVAEGMIRKFHRWAAGGGRLPSTYQLLPCGADTPLPPEADWQRAEGTGAEGIPPESEVVEAPVEREPEAAIPPESGGAYRRSSAASPCSYLEELPPSPPGQRSAEEEEASNLLDGLLATAPPQRRPTGGRRAKLHAALVAALGAGWTPDALHRQLDDPLSGVRSVYAVLRHRIGELGAPPPRHMPPAMPVPQRRCRTHGTTAATCAGCRADALARDDRRPEAGPPLPVRDAAEQARRAVACSPLYGTTRHRPGDGPQRAGELLSGLLGAGRGQ